MERYYQEEIECAPREKIVEIQNEKLVPEVQTLMVCISTV